jgi:hypothetical protein
LTLSRLLPFACIRPSKGIYDFVIPTKSVNRTHANDWDISSKAIRIHYFAASLVEKAPTVIEAIDELALVMDDIDPYEIASFHLGSIVGKKKKLVDQLYVRMRPTKCAADKWDSPRFPGIFLASGLYSSQAESRPIHLRLTQIVRR